MNKTYKIRLNLFSILFIFIVIHISAYSQKFEVLNQNEIYITNHHTKAVDTFIIESDYLNLISLDTNIYLNITNLYGHKEGLLMLYKYDTLSNDKILFDSCISNKVNDFNVIKFESFIILQIESSVNEYCSYTEYLCYYLLSLKDMKIVELEYVITNQINIQDEGLCENNNNAEIVKNCVLEYVNNKLILNCLCIEDNKVYNSTKLIYNK